MKLINSLVLTIFLALILSSCTAVFEFPTDDEIPESFTPTAVQSERIIEFTPVLDGPNEVDLMVGDILVVKIPTIPQDSYDWVLVDHNPDVLFPEGEGVYIEDADPNSAGGVVEFRVAAIGSGESLLNFEFRNQMEGVSSKSYGMTVTVSDETEDIVVVTPDATGPQITELMVGDVLLIELPTIPEEGYAWIPVDLDPKILVQIGSSDYIANTSADSAGGVTRLKFKAVSPGETILNLGYVLVTDDAEDFVSQKSFGMTVIVSGESSNIVVVTPDPTGPQNVELKVGDVLVIELPTIPEEFYEWIATDLDTTILNQVGKAEYIPDTSEDSAGGITRLQFEAVGPGEVNLGLAFVRMAEFTSEFVAKNTFGILVTVNK